MSWAVVIQGAASLAGGYLSDAAERDRFAEQSGFLVSVINAAVEKMTINVGLLLNQNMLHKAQLDAQAANESLLEWQNDPEGAVKMSDILFSLNESLAILYTDWKSIDLYAVTANSRFFGMVMYVIRSPSRGAIENAINFYNLSIGHMEDMKATGGLHYQQFINGVTEISYNDIEYFPPFEPPHKGGKEFGAGEGNKKLSLSMFSPQKSILSRGGRYRVKAFYHDNGREINVINVIGSSLEEAKQRAYSKLKPGRDSIIAGYQTSQNNWYNYCDDVINTWLTGWQDAGKKLLDLDK